MTSFWAQIYVLLQGCRCESGSSCTTVHYNSSELQHRSVSLPPPTPSVPSFLIRASPCLGSSLLPGASLGMGQCLQSRPSGSTVSVSRDAEMFYRGEASGSREVCPFCRRPAIVFANSTGHTRNLEQGNKGVVPSVSTVVCLRNDYSHRLALYSAWIVLSVENHSQESCVYWCHGCSSSWWVFPVAP